MPLVEEILQSFFSQGESEGLERQGRHLRSTSHTDPGLCIKPLGVLARHSLMTGGRATGKVWPLMLILPRGVECTWRHDARRKRQDLRKVINRNCFGKEDQISEEK